ncbi:carbohydrate kinase [Flavobacterium sp. MC2016-06]|jgi:fructokinase|uniref:carbohydrate kinase family protein n=1 Tax=Flavobacterium sp. MC2016-06 TaxID=2676308 RepID=UPI0012BA7A7B|nr:carbohydrate kinase [Flavobacterium sp. MC2016-06]MBU3861563.1 carbohydrate kinase [Flavobacterium sp. MC2016-06]
MSDQNILKVVSYGEVLWDVFKNEKKIGGAPLNVALRMKSLGCQAGMISCVGNDLDGKAILENIENLGLKTDSIIKSEEYATGLVQVTLDNNGSASYEIKYPSAWDKIVLNDAARKIVSEADVLIYGSLVCRDSVSRLALEELLQYNVYKVFDVNLRKPHYNYDLLEKLMHSADLIKFNDEELLEIAKTLNSPFTSLEDNMKFFAEITNTRAVCVTKGKHGAALFLNGEMYHNNGYPVTVADTVGAGDSFLASLITFLKTGKSPQESIDFACAMGALVAQSPGANPEISTEEIKQIMQG